LEYGEKYLLYKGRVVFGKQTMPYFKRKLKEYSENEACFIFVNKGEIGVRAQDKYVSLKQDEAVLAKCMNYYFEPKKGHECIQAIAVLLYPSLVKEIFDFDIATSNFSYDFNLKQVVVDKLLTNFKESINLLIDNPELADENMIKTKIKEFVLLMSKSQNAPSELDFLAAIFNPSHVAFKITVQTNLYANLTIDELATLCHLSTSSFKRKFNEVFDESPKKYITIKKLEKAVELLKNDATRVSDVAYDVGFDSLATFNRNFTSMYGKSPSEYRLS
jgi:AraC-like DNA-binding protein